MRMFMMLFFLVFFAFTSFVSLTFILLLILLCSYTGTFTCTLHAGVYTVCLSTFSIGKWQQLDKICYEWHDTPYDD
ncbi:hypothetical protein E4U13_004176 [Claviceps humidiphila]|uniref:Uncharacterized protein n=1 Tax=Claviceps humidiphila TaxID=1294629 RepID=A0A9P7PZH8_9HYPO|nr:hypothetical protein E4U13_004176 [Claviceps humidiphila]